MNLPLAIFALFFEKENFVRIAIFLVFRKRSFHKIL